MSEEQVVSEQERKAIISEAVETMMRLLPSIIGNLLKQASSLHDLKEQFYSDNSDLNNHRPVVAKVIEEFELKNPGGDIKELLKKAAPEARRRIKGVRAIEQGAGVGSRSLEGFDKSLNGIL